MAVDISNTISLLQTLHSGIGGVTTAPTSYKASIHTAELPFVLIWPNRAVTEPHTFETYMTVRQYDVHVFVEPIGQNNVDAPVQSAITLLELFLDEYMNNTTLSDGVTQIVQVEDTGVFAGQTAGDELVYSGNFYVGFVCKVTVNEFGDIA